MISVRRGGERESTRSNWLDSRHTFTFGDYYDPKHMGFSHLRSSTKTGLILAADFRLTRTATWKSSPTYWKARWRIKTAQERAPWFGRVTCSG